MNILIQFISHETDKAKDDETSKETGSTIGHSDDDGVSEAVVVELVVAGQGNQSTPAGAERKEDLDGGVRPNLKKYRKLRVKHGKFYQSF